MLHAELGRCFLLATTGVFVLVSLGCTADGAPDSGDSPSEPNSAGGQSAASPCQGLDLFDECDTDGDVCTLEHCGVGGDCVWDDIVDTCEAQNNNPCLTHQCEPATGCVAVAFNVDAACDDDEPCTTDDYCWQLDGLAGYCTGVAIEMDDGNECTKDICDEAGVVSHIPFSGDPCETGAFCGDGVCVEGVCELSAASECNDGIACTADSCDPVTGDCLNTVADGFCVIDSVCVPAHETSADNACLVCDPGLNDSAWTASDALCEDGSGCTVDACDAALGCQKTVLDGEACDDGSACTTDDACVAGACVGTEVDCEDNNTCTLDFCFAGSGCLHFGLSGGCDDGDACTVLDECALGECISGAAIDCSDGDPCTTDAPCEAGSCAGSVAIVCDDGNACTTDPGCVGGVCPAAVAIVCDDGDACNGVESCQVGKCVAGVALSCSDDNPCTADSCDPGAGCLFAPLDVPCDDGDSCTIGDTCAVGGCLPGAPLLCNDNDQCTDDVCTAEGGCKHVQVFKPCDDGDACTTGDTCSGGVCAGPLPASCDDNNACTSDSCDAAVGCQHAPLAGGCDDDDACTTADSCVDGVCQSGGVLDCDDGNACTSATCDAGVGCVQTKLTDTPCDDGNLCTNNGCVGGACQVLSLVDCTDGEQCTSDGCNAATGCHNDALADGTGCDDGDACSGVCTLVEKFQVLAPHPGFPAFAFIGFGPIPPESVVFFNPTAQTIFEVDESGAARLHGPVAHVEGLSQEDGAKSWSVDCNFTVRDGPGSGGPFIQEQFQTAFQDQWTYFDMVSGACTMGTSDGAWSLSFTEKPAAGVFPFQKGPGASSFTEALGYSNWADYVLVHNGVTFTEDVNGETLNTDFHGKLAPIDECANLDSCQLGACVAGEPVGGPLCE